MGDATDFEVLWCTSDGTDNTNPSWLLRTICDYIDYEMSPTSNIIYESAIPHTNILLIKRMFGPISFPTHYFKSGIGIKKLSILELINLFGLLSQTNRINHTFKSCPTVPMKILDTLFAPHYIQDSTTLEATYNTSV